MTPINKGPQSIQDIIKQAAQAAEAVGDPEGGGNDAAQPPSQTSGPMDAPQNDSDESSGMPEGPGFMALYTTLMLLLMTFFIVLVSMGSPSEGDFEKGKKSLNASFSLMGMSGSKEAMFFVYSVLKIKSALVKEQLDQHIEREKQKKEQGGPTELEGDGVYWQDGFSKDEASQLHRFVSLGFNISSSDATKKYLKVNFPKEKIFEPGTAIMVESFKSSLKTFLNIIGTDYSKINVLVYTCEKPIKETGLSTELELSSLRAAIVAQVIAEMQEIDHEKIIPVGYGRYYAGVEDINVSKKELVELNIYNLWGSKVLQVDDLDGVEVSEETGTKP
jgi:flagellar motor protein MotB